MKFITQLFISLIFIFSSSFTLQDASKRSYFDSEYHYEFHINISNKKIKHKKQSTYFWYKLNKIHSNVGGSHGKVLHGSYLKKEIKSNQLLENGLFKNGLKDGMWKEWYLNGNLNKIENWNKGTLQGKFISFDKDGSPLLKGKYNNGNKNGSWVNYQKGDTITYVNGTEKVKKVKDKKAKNSFFRRLFHKKEKNNSKPKKEKVKKEKKKKSLWYRIFHKKEKQTKK